MSEKIVIIGGGPGGYIAALRAAFLGGDVTLVDMPAPGEDVQAHERFGDIESVKTVSELLTGSTVSAASTIVPRSWAPSVVPTRSGCASSPPRCGPTVWSSTRCGRSCHEEPE